MKEGVESGPRQTKPHRTLRLISITLLLALTFATVWFGTAYWRARAETHHLKNNPSEAVKREAHQLVSLVGKHMDLPQESPTIATVEDSKKLQDQTFFKRSQNGDKVLMYTKHKLAILYRPAADRIIEVAYLNIKTQGQKTP